MPDDPTRETIAASLLSEAASLLDSSLDYEATLRRVGELVVPRLADTSIIDVLRGDATIRRLEFFTVDPELTELKRVAVLERGFEPTSASPVREVLRTGEPFLAERMSEEYLRRVARSEAHLLELKKFELRSTMTVPLKARGRLVGALTLVTIQRSGRSFGPGDLTLAENLASVASLAIENARLYEDRGRSLSEKVTELRELSARLIRTQEDERRRIAADLHDTLGQAIAAQRLRLERTRDSLTDVEQQLELAIRGCEELLGELRRVVYDLRPPEIEDGPLTEILREYGERFEVSSGVETSFRAEGAEVEDPEIATCLLRILQETLTNVAHHARAREVGISLVATVDEVSLEVADDGVGFAIASKGRGAGLRSIRERATFLGGTVHLTSRPNEGTRLRVTLPLQSATV